MNLPKPRFNKAILALCLAAAPLTVIVSCGKNNDSNNQSQNSKLSLLQQKWNMVKIYDTAVSDNVTVPTVYREYTGKPGDYYYFRPDKTLDIVYDTASPIKTSDPYKFIESPLSYIFYSDTFHILELTSNKMEIFKSTPPGSGSYLSQHIYLSR